MEMLTAHAQRRLQQRAIPPIVIDLLLNYGELKYDHQGAGIYFFDNKWKGHVRNILRQNGLTQIDHCLDAYLVANNQGNVVTVGHLSRRINRI